jgi:hypothetical protein
MSKNYPMRKCKKNLQFKKIVLYLQRYNVLYVLCLKLEKFQPQTYHT